MAKRFTDSRKWFDPWFRKLPYNYKLFWYYIIDTCDHSGLWKVDIDLASFCIGQTILEDEILKFFNEDKERIKVIRKGMWFLTTFVEFQYGALSPNNNLHVSILTNLEKQGLVRGSSGVLCAPMDKDKVMDKEKDKVKREDLYAVLMCYLNCKNPTTDKSDISAGFKRFGRVIKLLLSTAKTVDNAKEAILWVDKQFTPKGFDWTLETVNKHYDNYIKDKNTAPKTTYR